ncbi:Peptidase-S9 domain-containing protein [Mycena chlorophos]|uniref:Peptidase-S9 domain-containing protein n=1 Tax=Mycena chlorophos TaxID=658473 RepID=A0A8H6VYP9_MYCCL|nr:Peptidase-S9 domain-containing protein [Mycena chlorophos]
MAMAAPAPRTSTKLQVPHPVAPDCPITGVLERLDGNAGPTHAQGRPIALILHGAMGHKDYLFLRRLAQRLPMDSFRFDFRGNHETPGSMSYARFENDVEDLDAVAKFLEGRGYVVTAVVGHSRGSIVGQKWVCVARATEARHVTTFVNASGRYRMEKILESSRYQALWKAGFEKDGYADWTATVARKPFTVRVYPHDIEEFTKWDTSYIWDEFPANIHVLTIHGLSDETVPPYDAIIYARALGTRSPGTHTLHMLEGAGADHNYTGRQDEIVACILDWWEMQARGEISTSGVWMAGVKVQKNKL